MIQLRPVPLLVYVVAGVFGAIIGSFLNILIHRLPECRAAIAFHEKMPVFSYFWARGNCQEEQTHIATRYPAVEALTAFLWVALVWRDGLSFALPFDLVFVTAIVGLIFIDAGHMILPNVITYPGIVFALLARLILPYLMEGPYFDDVPGLQHSMLADWSNPGASVLGAILGALIGGGSLWLMGKAWKKFRGMEAMGLGDVKMMFMVGAYLGWRLTILTIFLGALSGSVIGVALTIIEGKKDLKTLLPYGVYLGVGTIVAMFYGAQIIDWYLQYAGFSR